MADKKYELEFGLSDGTSQKVQFTAPQGPQGIQGEKGADGATGATGAKGADGTSVTVKTVSESTVDGGSNVVTFSDGKTVTVKNGNKGTAGKTAYEYAKDGGYTGTEPEFAAKMAADVVSVTYDESTKTLNISSVSGGGEVTAELVSEIAGEYDVEKIVLDGVVLRLPSGADGYTPVKGVDYYTDAEQEDIVQQVITALATPVFGTVDGDNVITLSGELADGIYTIRYEDADGTYTTIGTLINKEVTYTNVLALATDENGDIWNGVGYADGYRLQSYNGTTGSNSMAATEGYFITGFIPYTLEQAKVKTPFYIKGIELDLTSLPEYLRIALTLPGYTDWVGITTINDMTDITEMTVTQLSDGYYKFTPNSSLYSNNAWNKLPFTHARFSMPGSGAGVIITVNEPIE